MFFFPSPPPPPPIFCHSGSNSPSLQRIQNGGKTLERPPKPPALQAIGVATLFSFNFLYSCSTKTEFVLLGCQILKCGFIFPCCLYVKSFFLVAVFLMLPKEGVSKTKTSKTKTLRPLDSKTLRPKKL